MSTKRLTQKQYDFVNHYITNGFNAEQASLAAGYSKQYSQSQSYKLPSQPAIAEHLSHAYKKAEENTEISFEWIINKYMKIISAFERSPLSQDARVVIAALAELAKMRGFYAPDKKLSVTVNATQSKMEEVRKIYNDY